MKRQKLSKANAVITIEVPDEKEVTEEANRRFIQWDKEDWSESGAVYQGFIDGANWMREEILNQVANLSLIIN